MQLISNFNKAFRFSLCVFDIYSKYEFVITFKDKKGITILNFFQKILDNSTKETKKIWVDKFFNSSFKKWLKDIDIEMHLTHNEEKSVIAERFIKTLKNKIISTWKLYQKMCILINWII